MAFEKELQCPRCKKENIENLPFFYQTLKSGGFGKNLFTETPFPQEEKRLSLKQEENLLKELAPPREPKTSLPAGPIAFMAFLISWLTTSSFIISRIGKKAFGTATFVIVCLIGLPFYFILNQVIKDFIKKVEIYRKEIKLWKKKFVCQDCYHVFFQE